MKISRYLGLTVAAAVSFSPLLAPAEHEEEKKKREKEKLSRSERLEADRYGTSFHDLERADRLLGQNVQFTEGGKAGKIHDIVVDLESGRALYVVLSDTGNRSFRSEANRERDRDRNRDRDRDRDRDRGRDGDRDRDRQQSRASLNQEGLAVPATAFHATQGRALRIDVTESQLSGAPRISMDATEQMESVSFASDVYRHYNQQPWWGGGSSGNFGNVHSIRQLRDAKIENVQNTPIGDIEDVVLDLPAGRVLFVVVQADEQFNLGNQLTAIPPNMFTKSRKSGVLIADLDREKLANAPGFNQNRWPDLENYEFASRVYQHFGKTPYFKDSPLAPTGEEERENQRRNRRDRRD